ncbi:MAG TPA: glycoside hydrolase family 44 protein [Verrucomicrobiae bacterium]
MLNALRRSGFAAGLAGIFFLGATAGVGAQTDQPIYTDSLQNGWQNWSWATVNFANPSPAHGGSASISVSSTNWQALYLHHSAQDGSLYASLTFWVNGGSSGGQSVQVQATRNGVAQTPVILATLPINSWRQETVSLAALGVANVTDFDGFWLQVRDSGQAPMLYVDDFTLVAVGTPPPTITLTSPANGALYTAPATIPLAGSVITNSHQINKVQFYSGANLLAEDLVPPYAATWNNPAPGSYSVVARVTYDGASTRDSAAASVLVASNTPITITVDAQLNRHPISPLIYGVAFASSNAVADLNAPLNRSGGNAETRYNWQLNAHNRAADWYFESLADSPSTPGAAADDHIAQSKNGGALPMLTIPMIGWLPTLGSNRGRLASYSIAKYGLQAAHDWQWFPDAGNGIITNTSTPITNNNPRDASFLTNSLFQQAFLQLLTNRWGSSTNGGVRYYLMDNEHTLWHATHRDVHPVGTTMQEIRDKFFDYAGMVKAVDPSALVAAPEEWGWNGYLYSGYDLQWSAARGDYNPAHYPDRGTNGGWDYMPWLLNQIRQRATDTNQRLLDIFTLHIYPQGANESGNDVSLATQLGRNRSTRALWDTNYVDASWINSIIKLIPRMKGWVAAYYPGTQIGITEYNWGAEGHINGATAQADILGVFGREGLDLATRWTTPAASTPTYKAMKLYRNYDGNNSGFGDVSVNAVGPNPDAVAVFAAQRTSDGALTIMVINKQLAGNALPTVNLANFLPRGTAQIWQLTSANAITRLPDLTFTGGTITNTLPPQSVTLLIVPGGTPPNLRAGAVSATNTFDLWLDGQSGQRYALQSSSDFVNWTSLETNTLAGTSLNLVFPATNAMGFFRARWLP